MKTLYKATFTSGISVYATSDEYNNRLAFYNYICQEQMGERYGDLVEITCQPVEE